MSTISKHVRKPLYIYDWRDGPSCHLVDDIRLAFATVFGMLRYLAGGIDIAIMS